MSTTSVNNTTTLTSGSVSQIKKEEDVDGFVLQVIKIKPTILNSVTKHLAFLSDGKDVILAILNGKELNVLAGKDLISIGSVIRLISATWTQRRDTSHILMVDEAQIIMRGSNPIIGSPVEEDFEEKEAKVFKPQPLQTTKSAVVKKEPELITIADIGAFNANGFKFIAKVYSRSSRSYKNQKGEGRIANIVFQDKSGAKIQLTMFNDSVDTLYPTLIEDNYYLVENPGVGQANEKFNKLGHPHELTVGRNTKITRVDDTKDNNSDASMLNLVHILDLAPRNNGDVVDVMAIVHEVRALENKISQKGFPYMKRSLILVDQDLCSVELTIFGEQAKIYDETKLAGNPVILLESVERTDFNSISLKTGNYTKFTVNPTHMKECSVLRDWYDLHGPGTVFDALTKARVSKPSSVYSAPRMSLAELTKISPPYEKMYVSVKGTIIYTKHDTEMPPWYIACATLNCKKKLEDQNGNLYCSKCDKVFADGAGTARYNLQMHIVDETTSSWLTCFDEVGSKLLGIGAQDLAKMLHDQDFEGFENAFDKISYENKVFTVSVQQTNRGGETTTQYGIEDIQDVDPIKEIALLEPKL